MAKHANLDAWITGNDGYDHPDNFECEPEEEDTVKRTLTFEQSGGVIVNDSGLEVGDRVRSFDFESREIDGDHAYYMEGTVVALVMFQGCARYRIKVEVIVRGGIIFPMVSADFDHVLPPINGTPKLLSGTCDGVELIVSPFTWGTQPILRHHDNGAWILTHVIDEETTLSVEIRHDWRDEPDDFTAEVTCSMSSGFRLVPVAERPEYESHIEEDWMTPTKTNPVCFYEQGDIWDERIKALLDTWTKLNSTVTFTVSF